MKNTGFVRKCPQTESLPRENNPKEGEMRKNFDSDKCNFVGSNNLYLANHISSKHKENEYNCDECDFQGSTEIQVRKHKNLKHPPKGRDPKQKENEYNCEECDFQGSTEMQIRKHKNLKHTPKGMDTSGTIKCRICGQEFIEKWNLMRHRKNNHMESVAYCRNFEVGNCSFTSESCWWNHEIKSDSDSIKCFICGMSFETKNGMMVHRKQMHSNIIKPCTQFLKRSCRFQDELWWFKHDMEEESTSLGENLIETESESDFQKAQQNHKPPSGSEKHNGRK